MKSQQASDIKKKDGQWLNPRDTTEGMNIITESQNPTFTVEKTIHVLFTEATVGWVFILPQLKPYP